MAIQNNFPAIKPSLMLDFANVKALDPRITFTRASTATFYNGVTTAKAEENLLIRSQEFDAFGWTNNRTSISANSTTAPDGTTTADTLTNTTATGAHAIDQSTAASGFLIVSGLTYTISVFAKKSTNDFFQITTFHASNSLGTGRANFNLATGAAGSVDGGTSTITDVGNGWFRCTYTVTASASGGVNFYFGIITSSTAARFESYTGLGTEAIFLWGAQVEQRSAVSAYTATTTQPITNYIPVLQTAASGVARFEHNPTTFESLGLEIEEQRTNLLTYSEQFDNAAWTTVRATISANTIVAPDGTLTGDKLVEDTTASNNHFVRPVTVSVTSGVAYTYAIFAKAGERTQFQIDFGAENSAFANSNVEFTLTGSGTATVIAGSPSFSITAVGNGWYRCTVTATATATASAFIRNFLVSGTNSYTGNGYSGIYIWGAQLEAGAFPTSYIPTVASQVTRAADSARMTGTNFSSWYNAAEGTVYSESASVNHTSGFPRVWSISDDTGANFIQVFTNGSADFLAYEVNVSSVNQCNLTLKSGYVGQAVKAAVVYRVNDYAGSADAGAVVTDTSGTIPSVNILRIGEQGGTGGLLNGTIRKIAYYPLRVTNAQLQALTS